MRFTTYLIETHKKAELLTERHELVLQKVIDAVDNGHVEYGDSKIAFDIGDISDTPQLHGLKLVIRPGKGNEIKLGQSKDGGYAIVIHADKMPGRKDIDSFLASKDIYSGFRRAYAQYLRNHHDHDKEYTPNDTQQKVAANSRDTFEGSYNDLMSGIADNHKKYSDAVAEIDKELDRVANVGRKKSLELAKEKLRDEYLGKDSKEFIGKVMKLPQADFTKHLDKDWKTKLESRLGSYYTSNYNSR